MTVLTFTEYYYYHSIQLERLSGIMSWFHTFPLLRWNIIHKNQSCDFQICRNLSLEILR